MALTGKNEIVGTLNIITRINKPGINNYGSTITHPSRFAR